jgi:hypothetical protein
VEVPNPKLGIPAGVKYRATLPIATEIAKEIRPGKNQARKP